MKYLIKNKLVVLGVIIGAFGGFLYYQFIGCSSGSCAITSSPWNSSLYGSFMGGLLFSNLNMEK